MPDNVAELLEQTSVWRDPNGKTYYVAELTDEQLGVALASFGQNPDALFEVVQELRRTMGLDFVPEEDRRAVDPVDWLLEQPLYRRLLVEQRRRAL